ncbi:hypothetical protein ACFU8R_06685 [Pseudonocardia alni]|uniref:hypothetical protein n=1 Tax=Pseudonocardia alni TaxID=33907 RepID=UPI00368C5D7F
MPRPGAGQRRDDLRGADTRPPRDGRRGLGVQHVAGHERPPARDDAPLLARDVRLPHAGQVRGGVAVGAGHGRGDRVAQAGRLVDQCAQHVEHDDVDRHQRLPGIVRRRRHRFDW